MLRPFALDATTSAFGTSHLTPPLPRLASLEDSLKANIKKVEGAEKDLIKRTELLEERLGGKVVSHVEAAIDIQVQRRLQKVEAQLNTSLGGEIGRVRAEAIMNARSWLIPFVIIVIFMAASMLYSYRGISKISREKLP